MKLPYGFDADFPNMDDDPWTKLATINEYLEAREVVPPDLAQWLGHAIQFANANPNEFLSRLDLKAKRGRPQHRHSKDAWLEWGAKIYNLEDALGREGAIAEVARQYADLHDKEPARDTLQKWREKYAAAK